MAKILISIDHKWRDLPAYVYAAMLLEEMGHKVKLARTGFEPHYVVGFQPDLVVFNHLFERDRQKFAHELRMQGVHVVVMPTEGIPTMPEFRNFAAGLESDLSSVSLHLVWNQPMANILEKNTTIDRSIIRVVGCPRFDFYRPPLSSALTTKADFCRERGWRCSNPVVTFATNFTQAQFHEQNKTFLREDARRLGYGEVIKKAVGSLENMAKRDFQSREILLEAFCNLIEEMPSVNFILKPHPSEDHQYYYGLLEGRLKPFSDRLCIITSAYIWDILSITDIELKRSCTTGIESWMIGIPTIEMALNPDEWYYSEEHASGSYVATTYSELKSKITNYIEGESLSNDLLEKRQNFIDKWCFSVDGQRTAALANEIHDLIASPRPPKKIKLIFKRWLIWFAMEITDCKVHDLKLYGVRGLFSKKRIDRLGRVDKFFRSRDVSRLRNKFLSIMRANRELRT
jgi:surface carbohydrate biosynthesis protein